MADSPKIFQCTVVDFLERYTVGETVGTGGAAWEMWRGGGGGGGIRRIASSSPFVPAHAGYGMGRRRPPLSQWCTVPAAVPAGVSDVSELKKISIG